MTIPYLSLKAITELHKDELTEAVTKVVDSGWYLQGKANEQFEKDYSTFIGTKYCVGCANGLDALILIFRAYKELGLLHDGDEVIVPANTYIASILAVTENNLQAVPVEPKLGTYQIDDTKIEDAITEKTRAILLVHLYGRCSYTEKIAEITKKHNLLIIEDNAQAQGCKFGTKRTGSLGDAAGHSFYPGKNLGAFGDAGCVTTDNQQLADCVRSLANYGQSKKYVFQYCGRNSRLDETNAAVLSVKLKYLDKENERRKAIARIYNERITNPKLTLPLIDGTDNIFHIYPVLCAQRDDFQKYLLDNGIHTMIHYPIAPHQQKCYADMEWYNKSYPITEKIHREELSLPLNQALKQDEIDYIIDIANKF